MQNDVSDITAAAQHPSLDTPLEISFDDQIEPIDDSDNEVRILGYGSLADGDSPINLATVDVEGQSVYMVDLENDNVYDLMYTDPAHTGDTPGLSDDILPYDDINLNVDDGAYTDPMADMPDPMSDDLDTFDMV